MASLFETSAEELLTGIQVRAPIPGPTARVLVVGDICAAHARTNPSDRESRAPWSGLRDLIDDHDLRLATLECPLSLSGETILKTGPRLRAHPAWAAVVREGGFDLVSLANNHIRDCGAAGVLDTVAACEAAGLQTVGVGENAARARVPVIAQAAGLKVGILAVAENEFGCAGQRRAGGNPFDPTTTPLAVRELSREADAVLVLLHGGVEGYRLPSPGMTRICRALIEAGASAVVCCHTHVPGGLEFHRDAPIVYGTGNFFFQVPPGLSASDDFFVGYCVSLWIGRGGVRQLALAPYRQDSSCETVEPLDEGDALGLMRQTLGLSTVIADEEVLAERWEEFCAANRVSTLAPALGLSRIERRLLRHGVWPFWRLRRRSVPALLNAVRCESHLERLTTTLTSEYEAAAKQASPDRKGSDDGR